MATNTPQDEFHKTGVRMPKDVHAKLHDAAAASGRSYNAEIVARLQASFEVSAPERVNELELELSKQHMAAAAERGKASRYVFALMAVAERVPSDAFADTPQIAEILDEVKANKKAIMVSTLKQMMEDTSRSMADIDSHVAAGRIKVVPKN